MNWLPSRRHTTRARQELASLTARIGMETMSQWAPGLLAEVDQHAAAVRDILVLGNAGLGPAELADYARGIEDVARDHGRDNVRRPGGGHDWVWLRLAGVCMLATADGAMASIADGDAALS
ncbi:DUF6401 family natural product biosynthesis protein [Jiangella mangrovi]|uniref:Uncharacterized protein n=1 Tax=Jiangella mangrovi TaxID=1524084 RepID=A0A7W9GMI0_9ACTN|nr:DUF6401 family natural product biosynthesis protein [Jiangella mangrovi]MBB5786489.1 hypothetical protein [Jiangella mangrovi]